MAAYYNEIDKFAAQWLREIIKAGLIADGEVDERSIEDVIPSELVGFTQCHFFAGIGGWSYALRLAGWPDDRPVWTGSCPCQPFSAAGQGKGTSDERHLWPAFEWLIRVCRPNVLFGEQVESAIKHDWLDHVALSMEGIGYSVGAVGFPACSVGAPHIRQRLYWVAQSDERGLQKHELCNANLPTGRSPARRVADADNTEQQTRLSIGSAEGQGNSGCGGNAGVLGDSETDGREMRKRIHGENDGKRLGERCATNGFWRNAEWLPCRDGKVRPTGSGISPLVVGNTGRLQRPEKRWMRSVAGEFSEEQMQADSPTPRSATGFEIGGTTQSGIIEVADELPAGMVHSSDQGAPADEIGPQNTAEARVGRLRGFGNAIVAEQAAAFIKAVMVN